MTVYHNLRYFNGSDFIAGEIAVDEGVIQAVGEHLDGGHREDLGGAFVSPAFNDCHCHITMLAESFSQVSLGATVCPSILDVLARLRAYARDNPNKPWIIGNDFSQGHVTEKRYPSLMELDAAIPDRPVAVWHASRHGIIANSAALRMAGVDSSTEDPPGGKIGRDGSGNPDGLLFENACGFVRRHAPRMTKEELTDNLLPSAVHLRKMGITAATDASSFRFGMDEELWAYETAVERGMKLRVRLTPLYEILYKNGEIPTREKWNPWSSHPLLEIGAVKLFSDGAIGTRTAAITGKYQDAEDGLLIWSQAELNERVAQIHEAGRQVLVHAIGDRAAENVICALESAQASHPRNDCRHRIDHSMVLSPELIARFKRAGVAAGMQPEFLLRFGDEYLRALGERAKKIKPIRSLLSAGVALGFSSDLTIVPGNPVDGMLAAIHRTTTNGTELDSLEAITPAEALNLYTAGAAYLGFQEKRLGRIAPKMHADMVLFADDPLAALAAGDRPHLIETLFGGERA